MRRKFRGSVAKILTLCAPMPKKYGDRVMEKKEKKRVALFLCQAKREHSRLVPQELCPPPWWVGSGYVVRQGYDIRIKAATLLHSFFCKFSKEWGC